jgi:peroxiredoxin Q/BCP
MPPELRKRKAPQPAPEPPAKKTTKSSVAKAAAKVKEAVTGKPSKAAPAAKGKANGSAAVPTAVDAPAATKSEKPAVGDIINLDGFGGEVETNDGKKTTLKALVDESKAGVVLFTYPKASTPGCKISCLPSSLVAYLSAPSGCAEDLRPSII